MLNCIKCFIEIDEQHNPILAGYNQSNQNLSNIVMNTSAVHGTILFFIIYAV